MNDIDAWLYINLEKRPEKRAATEARLLALEIPADRIVRIEAVDMTEGPARNGNLGCSLSHLRAVEYAIEKRYKRFCVLEDDFEALQSREVFDAHIQEAMALQADVFMVAHSVQTYSRIKGAKYCLKVHSSHNRCAYIVTGKFAPKLRQNYVESVRNMVNWGRNNIRSYGDQWWKRLQKANRWYASEPKLAHQQDGYSDNFECIRAGHDRCAAAASGVSPATASGVSPAAASAAASGPVTEAPTVSSDAAPTPEEAAAPA